MNRMKAESSAQEYTIDASIKGTAQIEMLKLEVYGHLVREMMDLVSAARNPNHKLKVTLEDVVNAVAIAEQATISTQCSGLKN